MYQVPFWVFIMTRPGIKIWIIGEHSTQLVNGLVFGYLENIIQFYSWMN